MNGNIQWMNLVLQVRDFSNDDLSKTHLDTMISIGEIVHWFELLVDNSNTCFMSADRDFFDILGGFSLFFELGMNTFSCFNGRLRMEFRCDQGC